MNRVCLLNVEYVRSDHGGISEQGLAHCVCVGDRRHCSRGQEASGPHVKFGLGAQVGPDYPGASSTGVRPTGAFAIQGIILPGGIGIETDTALPTEPGFSPRGSFRYVPSRTASENPELQGLGDIDFAVELGAGLYNVTQSSRVFAQVRRGFGGYDGWVAQVGIDGLLRPTPQLVLSAGPRANWGDRNFVNTYFGVSQSEAARSQYASFSADGGLVSVGVELNAVYDFRNGWGLQGTLGWDQLQNDAARSPITKAGSADSFGARLMVTRRFGLNF